MKLKDLNGEIQYVWDNRSDIIKGNLTIDSLCHTLSLEKTDIYRILSKLEIPLYKGYENVHYNIDFFRKPSNNSWYFAGLYASDGSLLKASKRVFIGLKSDEYTYLRDVVGKFTDAPIKFRSVTATNPAVYGSSYRKVCRSVYVEWSNKDIVDELINHYHVIDPVTLGKPSVFNPDKKFASHFIRGYFDGDGTVNKTDKTGNVSVRIVSCSRAVVSRFKDILKDNGIVSTLYELPHDNWEVSIPKRAMNRFYHFLYGDCDTMYLPRKRAKFEKYIKDYVDYDFNSMDVARLYQTTPYEIKKWKDAGYITGIIDDKGKDVYRVSDIVLANAKLKAAGVKFKELTADEINSFRFNIYER